MKPKRTACCKVDEQSAENPEGHGGNRRLIHGDGEDRRNDNDRACAENFRKKAGRLLKHGKNQQFQHISEIADYLIAKTSHLFALRILRRTVRIRSVRLRRGAVSGFRFLAEESAPSDEAESVVTEISPLP